MPNPHTPKDAPSDGADISKNDVRTHRFPPRRAWLNRLGSGRSKLTRATVALGVVAVVAVGMWASQGTWPASDPVSDAGSMDRSEDEHAGRSEVREPAPSPQTPKTTEPATEEPEEDPEPPQPVAGLDETQMANAVTVVEIGQELGFPERGQAVALVTAMQESLLRNVASDAVPESLQYDHEGVMVDYDSVGLFQQRPSMGWGTVEQCMNVEYSTTTFYNALGQVSGWENMELTVAAQTVQKSAYPDRYAQWEDMAWAVIDEVG